MQHYDFICDEGLTSLRLLNRSPADMDRPIESMRIQIGCSDCVAALDVDAASWAGFARLFTHDYDACESAAWIAPAGEWKLSVERNAQGVIVITSELDSLHDYHRWTLRTSFRMNTDRFHQTSTEVLAFIGHWL